MVVVVAALLLAANAAAKSAIRVHYRIYKKHTNKHTHTHTHTHTTTPTRFCRRHPNCLVSCIYIYTRERVLGLSLFSTLSPQKIQFRPRERTIGPIKTHTTITHTHTHLPKKFHFFLPFCLVSFLCGGCPKNVFGRVGIESVLVNNIYGHIDIALSLSLSKIIAHQRHQPSDQTLGNRLPNT